MTTIAPHGGTLVNRVTEHEEGQALLERLARVPAITRLTSVPPCGAMVSMSTLTTHLSRSR